MAVGIIGALMTAVYMARCVYLTFFGEFQGHGHPHESGPRIVVPLWILATLGVFAGLVNLPSALAPDSVELRFEHLRAVGAYFHEHRAQLRPPRVLLGHRDREHADRRWASGSGSPGTRAGSRCGHHRAQRPGHAGYTTLLNKYYFDHLYTDVIAAGTKGRSPGASTGSTRT